MQVEAAAGCHRNHEVAMHVFDNSEHVGRTKAKKKETKKEQNHLSPWERQYPKTNMKSKEKTRMTQTESDHDDGNEMRHNRTM